MCFPLTLEPGDPVLWMSGPRLFISQTRMEPSGLEESSRVLENGGPLDWSSSQLPFFFSNLFFLRQFPTFQTQFSTDMQMAQVIRGRV